MKQRIQSLSQAVSRVPGGWWVVLLTLPALIPMLRDGFFQSDDGLFHVYRLAALDGAVRSGVFYPRWFPEFAFGYGQPVLNFYGPLSYYWGLPFTLLGADAVLAMKLVLATGLVASALGMYLFARLHLDRGPSLVAAVVYAYLPYHLVDLYVRGAVAEFLAFVWFPLLLWSFHRLVVGEGQKRLYRAGLSALLLAALVITHSLSALIFVPVLMVYVLILLSRERAWPAAKWVVLAAALALALSACYWLPVLSEAQYVGLGHDASQGYRDHLLPLPELISWSPLYPHPDDPTVARVFPLGLIQVVLFLAALPLLFLPRRRSWTLIFFLLLALVSAFMLATASLPLWQAFEGALAFLQYPWRFQALTALATAFLAGAVVGGWTPPSSWQRSVLGIVLVLATGVWALWRLPVVPQEPDLSVEAMWQMDRDHGQVGTTWTGEYLPVWVQEQRWALSHPAPDPSSGSESLTAGELELVGVGYTRYDLGLSAALETALVLHQFHYPGWQVTREESVSQGSQPAGVLGLASFGLPAGNGTLTVRLGHTPAQLWGTLVSLASALFLGVVLVVRYRPLRGRKALSPLLLAASYLLLALILLSSLAMPNGHMRSTDQVNANLADMVELLAFRTDKEAYQPGDTAQVTLFWRALRTPGQDYKAFVHLTDAALTQQPAQHDGDPGNGFTPTSRWLPGELVPDGHRLALPGDLAPGSYSLWAGMYDHKTVRNLSVLSADVPSADGRVLLGHIEVVSP